MISKIHELGLDRGEAAFMFNFSKRRKVLYLLKTYPQISQTYVKNEINSLLSQHEIKIVAPKQAETPDPDHQSYQVLSDSEAILNVIKEFRPDVIHTHYLYLQTLELVQFLSTNSGVPFTVRSHSFDTLGLVNGKSKQSLLQVTRLINGDNCLGVLCFPFVRGALIAAGAHADKLVAVPPVVASKQFYNRDENGTDIINVGAAFPKKKMEDFVRLSTQVPDREFNLYAVGYDCEKLKQFNTANSGRVNFPPLAPWHDMPAIYKRHGWLVYTACPVTNSVGWPLAIAEAQAAGLGVCMANIRPDLREYVGDSVYLYDDIMEVCDLIRQPLDRDRREAGFQHALEMDIGLHISKLTDLWNKSTVRAGECVHLTPLGS
jgi:hypothetical protein